MKDKKVTLNHGSGGAMMGELVSEIRKSLELKGDWEGTLDDSAYLRAGDSYLVFTTDSYTQSPHFFPGGNIGNLAVTGTLNDLAVMGAKPIALSLSII
ncbi:MAG: hydrogenase expression/formation protein HypE, partial [Candidatus Aenigmarchaeota archaeon]|nr:hydrogenase expression/formation protein HypE [Candidatus Aenigmarchaeota archaeon]